MGPDEKKVMDVAGLRAAAAGAAGAAGQTCRCAVGPCPAWESVADDRWPARHMQQLGTLRDPQVVEPTFEEHHPHGTRYDSVDAPIAIGFFPYNRCDVFACGQCQRRLLRYTEYGGYYVDHRVRELRADCLPS
jgi:hypothetical protein